MRAGTAAVALAILGGAFLCGSAPGGEEKLDIRWRWVYSPTNFQVDANVPAVVKLMERARKAGYNGIMIGDWKWGNFENRPARYYENMKKVKAASDRIGIEIVAMVAGVGWSSSILQNNPNMAEGIEVRDCVLAVKDGKATVANRDNILPFGGFEKLRGNGRLDGWSWYDSHGTATVQDAEVFHSGKASVRMSDFDKGEAHRNCRLNKTLKLKPWHQYLLTMWVKSEEIKAGQIKAIALQGKVNLLQTDLGIKSTQDWTEHKVYFNTWDNPDVRVYVGLWGARSGRIWFDDIRLSECAGINMLRRPGCPVKVTSSDGATVYEEGRDFERWEYAKMGREPWPGSYRKWHPEPPLILTPESRIKEGDRIRASYYNTAVVMGGQVACCLSEEELFKHFETQIRNVNKYFAPKKWMLGYDELRLAGHCALCKKEGRTAGQVLAEHAKRLFKIVKDVDPDAEVFTWNDMFDPFHNAKKDYYLVYSTFEKSWEGLDPSIGIVNWYSGARDKSLPFFAGRGHKQVIGAYYDNPNYRQKLAEWLESARKVEGVHGVAYCTWRKGGHKDLEGFGRALDELLKK